MRYTPITLNGQAFSMPAITLGTVRFGNIVDRETAFAQMDYYYAQGGTWIDTARVYCVQLIPPGDRRPEYIDSEEAIGQWLKARGLRDKITLVTKGAHWSLETREKRVSPDAIRYDMALSLQKLGVDSVDIYFLHNDDETVPVSDIMPVLHQLVTAGRARAVGASNWRAQRIAQANAYAREHGLTPFSISQVKWSYAQSTDKQAKPTIDMHADASQYQGLLEMQMPVMAYSSQANGFFLKTAALGFDAGDIGPGAASFLTEENIRRANIVKDIAQKQGVPVSAASLGYLWSRQVPVTALVGCSTLEHLQSSLEGCDWLPPDPQAYN